MLNAWRKGKWIRVGPDASALPPERGCPQPQHIPKGAGLQTLGQCCMVGAAVVGDSRAPALS